MTLLDQAKYIQKEIRKLGLDIEGSYDGEVYDISTDEVSLLINCKNHEWELNSPGFVDYSSKEDHNWLRKLEDLPYIFYSAAAKKMMARRVGLKKRFFYEKKGQYYQVDTLELVGR